MNIFIKTYGCQMNERDSEAMAGMLSARGHIIVDDEKAADVLLFNTCSVREQAEKKAIGKIGFMKKLKKINPDLIIGALGCMAQARGDSLFRYLPHLDFVLGTGQLHRLPELVESIRLDRRHITQLAQGNDVLTEMGVHYDGGERPVSAFIAITRGCNRFCSYCIVPYVRGREISRTIDDVLAEARELAASGVREIMLLGQNVAAFGLNGDIKPPPEGVSPFAELLTRLCEIEGLDRIRFTSPYVSYFNDKLIEAMAASPKICRNLHLPLQSGSDRILKAMNRHYTAQEYLEKVRKLRAAMPDITFSTDVIVGFPGEEEEDFLATRQVVSEVNYANAFIFKYSPRSGTKAAEMIDQVPQSVKEERNQILLADQKIKVKAAVDSLVGFTLEVLAEGPSKNNPHRWTGRTSTGWVVNFPPEEQTRIGDLLPINIEKAGEVSLLGKLQK